MWDWISTTWDSISSSFRAIVEIILLTVAIYQINRLFHATRGARILLGGLVVLVGVVLLIILFKLKVIAWIIMQILAPGAVVGLLVIFQPELRNGLARLGSRSWFSSFVKVQKNEFYENLCKTAYALSSKRIGGLFAIEREISLKKQVENGVILDAIFSQELCMSIFFPKSPLHDGGIILSSERISAVACVFPVSERELADKTLGLRHRSAMGITEETDAIAIVVSEETGNVSLAYGGKLQRNLSQDDFKKRLQELIHHVGDYEKTSDAIDTTLAG